jgi:predicted ATPase/signal transduction histidine kinase
MKTTQNFTREITGYRLMEQLYCGSRTLVYRGIRQSDQQPVVIKLLRREYPTFNELLQFRHQYTIAKNLQLPGIVIPYSLEPYNHSYALVMEDFGGVALTDYIHTHPINLHGFLKIAIQLAEILHELHRHRVIHKDIKPANILIHPQTKQIKLIDFSIASLLPRETQEIQNPNVLEGTLAYISPEQTGRMNRGIDYRSDFYSLGVTLYELLAGTLPFHSDDPMELLHCHIAKKPPALEEVRNQKAKVKRQEREKIEERELPEAIIKIVMKLMAKNAEDRYQSALGLKYDLEKCLTQLQQTGTIETFKIAQRDICDRFIIPEKLYGREVEVQQLLDAFARVACPPDNQGHSEMMLVAGFSGIGKTAVINEVHKPIVRQRGYFIAGKFDQFNRNIPFSAFVQAFRDLMGQLLSESDAQLQTWKTKIISAVGENGQVLIEVIPELENIIGIQPAPQALSGSAAQNRFNLLMQKFVQIFTNIEHPLVIFLDDLQWADSASLQLIQLLMNDNGYLLMLGAYRDNEVSPTHPFILMLEDLKKNQAIVNTITLAPLTFADTNHLVADTLNCSLDIAEPLTELINRKTQGNPFFTTQFLKALHEDGYISFDRDQHYWKCDISQINTLALTDDVVEFMAVQLQKLPAETQQILKLAACIGNQFDLATLAIVLKQSPTDTAKILWKALQEGFILPTNQVYKFFHSEESQHSQTQYTVNSAYRFLHDRVQQAAYLLITQTQKQATHLEIGTLLLENLSTPERDERIFEIVNHLNIGRTLITQPSQRRELAQLNLLAGCKAKASTAYAGAFSYITTGMELLAENCWQHDYELTFKFHKERAEIEYLNGNFETAEIWIERTLENAKTPMEKAEVYNMSIVQYTLQAKYPEAIQAGRQALALIDIELPKENFDQVRDAELAITQTLLENRSFASLSQLPLMRQPDQQMAIKLLISMGPPTYRSHQRLWSVICAKAVNLCLQYGNTPEIGYIYPAFGGLRGYALNNYQGTKELLEVTIQLTQAFNNQSAQSVAYLMIGSSLRHWSHPLKIATEDYLASYRVGLESSNLQYAAYAFGHNMYCRFYQSVHLEKLWAEVSESLTFSQTYKNQWAIDLLIGGQLIISELLASNTDAPESLISLAESDYLEQCHRHKNSQVICIFNILKTQLLFLFNRLEEALEYGKKAEAAIINVAPQGLLPYTRHLFIYSLLLASHYHQIPESQKPEAWETILRYQKQLEIWAQECPENFSHLNCLVKAEVARISGNLAAAIQFYDDAIAGAKENNYTQEEALANELAGKFYLEWGKEKIAGSYMQEAYYCYARWGAKAKTDHLEECYPQLLQPILQQQTLRFTPLETIATVTRGSSSTYNSSSKSISDVLDFASILKAAQAISSSIQLDELIRSLTHILLENSGAKKSVLILPQNNTWHVKAMTSIDFEENSPTPIQTILDSQPVELCQEIPHKIIHYVKHTQQTVVIDQLKTSIPGLMGEYLLTHQPQSVLCMPILNQGKLVGIVYLENQQTRGVFTTERLQVINLLASQAAISLENARLYQQAQQALQDLQQAQLQIVQSEKMSALGNLVAGVAHEINNPVSFIAGNINPALDYVKDLLGLIDLYQQEYPQPNEMITEEIETIDLDYVREDLPKLINSMQLGINRIREISQSLRTFSRADQDYKVPFNIHEGIDSTLLILKHRLKANEVRPPIKIVKEYGDLPPIQCFPGQLNQVFMNILANAIDALEEANINRSFQEIQRHPNQIIIRTSVVNDHFVQIQIIDNGAGVSADMISKIFDHLFTTKAVGKGTGLGLAIARQIIVEKHGGSIHCNSSPQQGTEFVIKILRC